MPSAVGALREKTSLPRTVDPQSSSGGLSRVRSHVVVMSSSPSSTIRNCPDHAVTEWLLNRPFCHDTTRPRRGGRVPGRWHCPGRLRTRRPNRCACGSSGPRRRGRSRRVRRAVRGERLLPSVPPCRNRHASVRDHGTQAIGARGGHAMTPFLPGAGGMPTDGSRPPRLPFASLLCERPQTPAHENIGSIPGSPPCPAGPGMLVSFLREPEAG